MRPSGISRWPPRRRPAAPAADIVITPRRRSAAEAAPRSPAGQQGFWSSPCRRAFRRAPGRRAACSADPCDGSELSIGAGDIAARGRPADPDLQRLIGEPKVHLHPHLRMVAQRRQQLFDDPVRGQLDVRGERTGRSVDGQPGVGTRRPAEQVGELIKAGRGFGGRVPQVAHHVAHPGQRFAPGVLDVDQCGLGPVGVCVARRPSPARRSPRSNGSGPE